MYSILGGILQELKDQVPANIQYYGHYQDEVSVSWLYARPTVLHGHYIRTF